RGEQGFAAPVELLGLGHGGGADRRQAGEARLLAQHERGGGVAADVAGAHPPAVHERGAVVVGGDQQGGLPARGGVQVAGGEFEGGEHAVAALPDLGGQQVAADELALQVDRKSTRL